MYDHEETMLEAVITRVERCTVPMNALQPFCLVDRPLTACIRVFDGAVGRSLLTQSQQRSYLGRDSATGDLGNTVNGQLLHRSEVSPFTPRGEVCRPAKTGTRSRQGLAGQSHTPSVLEGVTTGPARGEGAKRRGAEPLVEDGPNVSSREGAPVTCASDSR